MFDNHHRYFLPFCLNYNFWIPSKNVSSFPTTFANANSTSIWPGSVWSLLNSCSTSSEQSTSNLQRWHQVLELLLPSWSVVPISTLVLLPVQCHSALALAASFRLIFLNQPWFPLWYLILQLLLPIWSVLFSLCYCWCQLLCILSVLKCH